MPFPWTTLVETFLGSNLRAYQPVSLLPHLPLRLAYFPRPSPSLVISKQTPLRPKDSEYNELLVMSSALHFPSTKPKGHKNVLLLQQNVSLHYQLVLAGCHSCFLLL